MLTLTKASILLTDRSTPPPEDAAWQSQSLPDNWSESRPGVGGFAWYRLEFELPQTDLATGVLQALYVPQINMNGTAYFNQELVGGDGQFDDPMTRLWYRPQFYAVPGSLIKIGSNVVHVRLKGVANMRAGLSEMYFGPAGLVEAKWRKHYLWQVNSVQMTSAITLVLGILAFTAWSLRRWESAYGYFGAGALLWVIRNTNFLLTRIPIPSFYWEVFSATAQVWVLSLFFLFALRFAHQTPALADRLIWSVALLTPLVLLVIDPLQLAVVSSYFYVALLLIGVYILKVILDVVLRERRAGPVLLLAASLVVFGLGIHDWFTHNSVLGFSEPYNLHFAAPTLFTVVTWNMFKRFVEAQAQAQQLAQSLEARVQQKTRELSETYETLRVVEAGQFKSQERSRIMQDMHDGLGSQLVSSLALAQSGELSAAQTYDVLRSCIDDLRLAIDTSTDSRDSLALALGNLRFRMEPRLKAAGISLKWNTVALKDDLPLPGEK